MPGAAEASNAHERDLEVGVAVMSACAEGVSLQESIRIFSKLAGPALGGSHVSVYLLSEDGTRLDWDPSTLAKRDSRMVARLIGEVIPDTYVELGRDCWHDRVLEGRQSVVTTDPLEIQAAMEAFAGAERLARFIPAVRKALRIESMISVPISVGGDIVGMADVHSAQPFTDEDRQRLDAMAVFLAAALEIGRTRRQLKATEGGRKELLSDLNQVFSASYAGLRVVDTDFLVTRANSAMSSLAGVPADTMLGAVCSEHMLTPECATRQCRLERVISGEHVVVEQVPVTRSDGVVRECVVTARPLMRSNVVAGIIESFVDVTELVRAQEELERHRGRLEQEVQERTNELQMANAHLEAATRAKDEFLARMSHELRTPLNSVIGFTGILLQELPGELNQEQRRQLEMVGNSAHHLLDLINEVLDLSQVEAGRIDIEIGEFDPCVLAHEVVSMLRPLARGKDLRIQVECLAGVRGRHANSDAKRVHQVLYNLVGNAIKYTESGSVTLRLDGDDEWLSMHVVDTGPGVLVDDVALVFEPFNRATDAASGTGLGLAVSRLLARRLGGDVVLERTGPDGSEFVFRSPWDSGPVTGL